MIGATLASVRRYVSLSWHLGRTGCIRALEYRVDLVLGITTTLLMQSIGLLLVGIVLGNFQSLAGWSLAGIALLMGLRSLSHGLFVTFLNPLRGVQDVIRRGDLDRLLLRPIGILYQVGYGGNIEFRGVGDFIAGLGYMAYATAGLHLHWTPTLLGLLALIVIAGIALEAALYTGMGLVAFWTMQDAALRQLAWLFHEELILYPISIYSHALRFALTFVLPFAFVNYYPAGIFLAASPGGVPLGLRPGVGYLAPAVAALALGVMAWLWAHAMRRYESTGS